MIQQFLFNRIVQVHVLVEEQVFLEQEYVAVLSNGFGSVGGPRVGVPVPLPLGHDVGQLFFGYQTPLRVAQHLINCITCTYKIVLYHRKSPAQLGKL